MKFLKKKRKYKQLFINTSYFSFWLALVAVMTLSQVDSNSSMPSETFLRHLSISAKRRVKIEAYSKET
jgi:hypothetical protein